MTAKTKRTPASVPIHSERFPGENADYRAARDKLLRAELNLRRDLEKIAVIGVVACVRARTAFAPPIGVRGENVRLR